MPCPHCGEMQVLRWERLQWPKGEPERAAYHCEHCAGEIQDWQKHQMLRAGEWHERDSRYSLPLQGWPGITRQHWCFPE